MFSEYPYVNKDDLNLDYILKKIRNLIDTVNDFIGINTIKIADPVNWSITSQYEPNTLVIDPQTGNAYMSVKPVPQGISIYNTDYWTPIFNYLYSDVYVSYRENVAAMKSDNGLTVGMAVATSGYYNNDDGGGAFYVIVDTEPETHYEALDNGLYAKLCLPENKVSVLQLGAIPDGVTDTTAAIQSAFTNYKSITIPEGKYYTTAPITLSGREINVWGDNSEIIYNGSESAFLFTGLQNVEFRIGIIRATLGSGIIMRSAGTTDYVQYINIYFKLIYSLNDCIQGDISDHGWVNEIRVYNGRFISGANGAHILKQSTSIDTCNNWNFVNVGVEGVVTGFFLENLSSVRIGSCFFVGLRHNENFTYLLKTTGLVQFCTFIGGDMVNASMLSISQKTNLVRFIQPTLAQKEEMYIQDGHVCERGYAFTTEGGIGLTQGEDLNDYNYPVVAYCGQNSIATSLQNCPVSVSFRMFTYSVAGLYYYPSDYNYLMQVILPNDATEIYFRQVRKSAGTWYYGSWSRHKAESALSEMQTITSGAATFQYRYNENKVEWWLNLNSQTFAQLTTIGNVGSSRAPAVAVVEGLTAWSSSPITKNGNEAIRITNAGDVQVISSVNYLSAHGVYFLS